LSLLNATEYATLRNESVLAAGGSTLPFANPSSFGKGTDWQSQIFSNSAYIQNSDLNISGGTEKSTYYSSVSYFRQEGIVTPAISNYSRLTARLNSSHKVTKWLTFGQNFSYSYTKSMGVDENNYYGGVLGSAVNIDPTTPTIITDPTVLAQTPYSDGTYGKYVLKDAAGNPYAISKYVGQEVVNPLGLLARNRGNGYGWGDKIVSNFYLELSPISGLKLRSNIGADLAFWGNESFTPLFYLSATQNNTVNTSFNRGMNKALNWIWTNTATYSRSFNEHNFTATVGAEARSLGNGIGVGATYNGLPYTSLGNASMNNVNINTLPSYQASGYEYQPYTIASLFARVNYDFRGKYLFTGVMRRDGSSHFGANQKYGTFPSASVGWIPSMENFWPQNNIVNFLKLRVGYGVNGNDNLDPFRYQSLVSTVGTYPVGGSQLAAGYAPLAPANPNLRWEQTSQSNFAIDATIVNNVSMSVDFFQKYTTGMLMQIQPPLFAGATQSPWGNIANMKNHGVEITLGYKKQFGQVGVNLNGNLTYVRNTVTQLDGVHDYFTYGTVIAQSYEISRKAVGQPVNAFYGFQRMGLFQTQADVNSYVNKEGTMIQPNAKPGDVKWADLNGDGKIDDKDRTFLGDPTPHYIFGFTASATYKNFDFKIFAQGVAGNKIYQALRRLDITTANYSTKALARWTGPGTSNDFPRLSDSDPNGNFTNPSSFYLQNGSFLRLKTIQLGYNFPKTLLGKSGVQNARLYVSVNNVYTFTKYNGFDPEIGGGLFGQDHGVYPQARSYMVGFNLTF
jgi:TonB-linked SusC/RagA family outer membrane protein